MLASADVANGCGTATSIASHMRRPLEMDSGELLTRWTVRIAMICYGLSIAMRLSRRSPASQSTSPDERRIPSAVVALWSIGCAFYLAHFYFAFKYFMRWSHAVAVEHTAVRSAEVVGLRFGGGIYFNYAFTAVWLFDAAWMLCAPDRYARRPRWYDYVVHGFMGFMAFHAVVTFGPSPTRWYGVAACVLLAAIWLRARSQREPRSATA
jgi:hypothetical protein